MDLDQRLNHESGFRYPAIDPENQIRLLRPLHPNQLQTQLSESQISCHLRYEFEVVDIKDLWETPYRALSYTWGAPSSSKNELFDITVDGQPFWVRRNLHEFLVSWASSISQDILCDGGASDHMQDDENSPAAGLIFIDAICIDQNSENIAERQAQVLLMREIYRRAEYVISWLGRPPDHAMRDAVRRLAKSVRGLKPNSCTATNCQVARWTPEERTVYRDMCHNRYWTRVWVLQEIVLARRVVVACGESVFPLALFAGRRQDTTNTLGRDWMKSPSERATNYRLRTILRPARDVKTIKSDILGRGTVVLSLEEMTSELKRQGAWALWETREYQSQLHDSLLDIIARYGHLECSDPRDKLYGFLGLMIEKSRKQICVDYDKGVEFAFYQGLKVGLVELVHEIEADLVTSCTTAEGRARRNGRIDRFYKDMSHAFRGAVSEEESERILGRVLDELYIKEWFKEVDSALMFREHGYMSEIISWRDFQKLSSRGGDVERKVDHGRLFRWHDRQDKMVKKVKKKFMSRIRGYGD